MCDRSRARRSRIPEVRRRVVRLVSWHAGVQGGAIPHGSGDSGIAGGLSVLRICLEGRRGF